MADLLGRRSECRAIEQLLVDAHAGSSGALVVAVVLAARLFRWEPR